MFELSGAARRQSLKSGKFGGSPEGCRSRDSQVLAPGAPALGKWNRKRRARSWHSLHHVAAIRKRPTVIHC